MVFSQLIEGALKLKASDIHLMENFPPYFRIDGTIFPVKHPPISSEQIQDILKTVVPDRMKARLEKERGLDVGYQHKDMVRCRTIVFFERNRLNIVIRLVPLTVPTIEDLELPTSLKKIAEYERGFVLVTGPSGSGKSTTLAAMIDHINNTKKISMITIEDPIEFYHENKKGIISQRQVGDDVETYASGVIQALRQDPDVLLLGEMRDPETMRTAIKAAETGLLIFSTLHTTNAIQTVERIISNFPQNEHDLVREMLSTNLKAVITQNLVKRAEGKGRIAALEIMIVNKTVSKLIADNRIHDIFEIMKGGEEGMQIFDLAFANLARDKKITEETGAQYSRDVFAYRRFLQGVQSSSDRGGIIGNFAT
jgi:twitching motility protein PilT